ncbi:MAG TPA: response regulator [Pyrinomonadaceae bacterium]|nr:response regulator [Pyrinomonadaceae bacterium]
MSEFRVTFREPIRNRVFIADDDPVMRHLLTAAVEQQHCEVVIASDGREAYRVLQSDSKFRAAILDMSMPFLEGLDIVHYMRSEKRLMKIPIMIITAEESLKLMNDSFSAGATAFLPKPFTSDQLESAIRMLLHSRKMSRGV